MRGHAAKRKKNSILCRCIN